MNFLEIAQNSKVYNIAFNHLQSKGLKAKSPQIARVSKAKHIRIENSIEDIERVATSLGIKVSRENIPSLSGKFTPLALTFPTNYSVSELAGQTIYVLSNLKGKTKVAQKQLIPAKLGLGNNTYKKNELVTTLRNNIPRAVKDEVLKEFLLQLVDVALKIKPAVDAEIMQQIDADTIRITGIDFGEILTPIILSDEADDIVFPLGNAMLADVEINGKPYSVKSASGSGTSFRAIKEYMDKFQEDFKAGNISLTKDEEEIHQFFRTFVDTEGRNVDKIIAASNAINTPENQKLGQLLGKKNFGYRDLVEFSKKFNSYGNFLKAIYPVSVAGGYKLKDQDRPNGLPADYKYYMSIDKNKPPRSKQSGKPSWDADKGSAGANILTYVLGTSFLADAKKLEKSEKYNNLIKRILGNVDASLAKIDITSDGRIKLTQTPFTDLDYTFQYHAPSHIPGNNLPGFSLVL